jgi:hypothetical protein
MQSVPSFWKTQEQLGEKCKIKTWLKFARRFALLQPSSASVERVWSIFSNFFESGDVKPLIDYIEMILMAKYNHRSENGDDVCL